MSNLTGQGLPRLHMISGCVCEGVSGLDKSMHIYKKCMALPKVGGPHLIIQKAEIGVCPFFLPHSLSWSISSHLLLPSDWDLHVSSLGSQAFGLNYPTSFAGSPACRRQIMGLSLHNCMNQFFIINLIYLPYIYNLYSINTSSVSLENPD